MSTIVATSGSGSAKLSRKREVNLFRLVSESPKWPSGRVVPLPLLALPTIILVVIVAVLLVLLLDLEVLPVDLLGVLELREPHLQPHLEMAIFDTILTYVKSVNSQLITHLL